MMCQRENNSKTSRTKVFVTTALWFRFEGYVEDGEKYPFSGFFLFQGRERGHITIRDSNWIGTISRELYLGLQWSDCRCKIHDISHNGLCYITRANLLISTRSKYVTTICTRDTTLEAINCRWIQSVPIWICRLAMKSAIAAPHRSIRRSSLGSVFLFIYYFCLCSLSFFDLNCHISSI
jgi:hypothetical protein